MKYLRALFAFSLIPFMAACSSSGHMTDGWNGCVIGGAAAGATAGVLLDGNVPGAVVGAGVGALAGAILCGDTDSDGDGVADGMDKCPGTPAGVAVDTRGCPIDSDGDGVGDYLDKCPNTPRGMAVGADGCPPDFDGDGVPDSADKCPGTPQGEKVDARGCPADADGDGVPDYADKCPGTPAGVKVDGEGCGQKLIVLHGIKFAFDSAKISNSSATILNRAVKAMRDHSGTSVWVVGHTDSVGADGYNQGLSEKRAAAVRSYLIKHGGISGARMETGGKGESQPIASNASDQGRALNRRVEFVIMK
jgi:OOP family OmpA-OmpF porin